MKPANISMIKFFINCSGIELDSTFKQKVIIDINRESIITGGDIPIDPITIARDKFTIRIAKSVNLMKNHGMIQKKIHMLILR